MIINGNNVSGIYGGAVDNVVEIFGRRMVQQSSAAQFRVDDYGAVGDGTTDDTAAVRSAIEAAETWETANPGEVAEVVYTAKNYVLCCALDDTEWTSTDRPLVVDLHNSNIWHTGEGSESTTLTIKQPDPLTGEPSDPATTWTVLDSGNGYRRIKRCGAFAFPDYPINNVRFTGMRISGGTVASGNSTVGGQNYPVTCKNDVLTLYSGREKTDAVSSVFTPDDPAHYAYIAEGNQVVFHSDNCPPEITAGIVYYMVNVTASSFQIAATLGGAAVTVTDTSNAYIYFETDHSFSAETLLRFGNTSPSEITESAAYFTSGSGSTFQISASAGGSTITLTDTNTLFFATDGDGWGLGHGFARMGSADHQALIFDDIHCDHFQAEFIHGGGSVQSRVTVKNSLFEYCNASMLSMPSLELLDSVVRYGYNGIENFGRSATNGTIVRRTVFTSGTGYGGDDSFGIAYLGSPDSSLVVDGCTFYGWKGQILLSESASNVDIINNHFYDNEGSYIKLTYLGIYSDPWRDFNDVTIDSNTFYAIPAYTAKSMISMQHSGDMLNFKFTNNEIQGDWNTACKYVFGFVIGVDVAGVAGSEISGNNIPCYDNCTLSDSRTRLIWGTNTYTGSQEFPGEKTDHFGDGPHEIYIQSERRWPRNHSGSVQDLHLIADSSIYPVGFTAWLHTDDDPWSLPAAYAGHAWTSDQSVTSVSPLQVRFNESYQWEVVV